MPACLFTIDTIYLNLPNFDTPHFAVPTLDISASLKIIEESRDAEYASDYYKRLIIAIEHFEYSLTENEQLAIRLVSFGQSLTIAVDYIGYYNPQIITFSGTAVDEGSRVQLVQHSSQISFLLMAISAPTPIPPKERIGFKLKHHQNETDGPDA